MEKTLKIGLALGSGAARGWAHIGVLQKLNQLGIYPQVIAGCSIGALVGAAYSLEKLEAMEQWVCGLGSWDVVSRLDFSLHRGGLVAGERVFNEAEAILGSADIASLPLRFAAVATELYSGREVWLQSGDLKTAVQASCAMPGLFAPRKCQGHWLIDGAVVNPVPISLCRAMGADIVIAVNLNSDTSRRLEHSLRERTKPVPKRAEVKPEVSAPEPENDNPDNGAHFWDLLGGSRDYMAGMLRRFKRGESENTPSMLGVMSASINIMQDRITRARMAGDPPEITVTPRLADFGMMDFHRAASAIIEGQRAVERALPQLEQEIMPFLRAHRPPGSEPLSATSADKQDALQVEPDAQANSELTGLPGQPAGLTTAYNR